MLKHPIAPSAPSSRSWVERLWSSVAERGRRLAVVPDHTVPALDRARLLADTLLSERGEASGAAVARELHRTFEGLGSEDRLAFYRHLATGFVPDEAVLRGAAQAYLAAPSADSAARLAEAAEPPRQDLLRRMNMSPGGTAALVAMRKEVLGLLRTNPELKPLDADLRHLLASWFNRGFLEIRRIDWQTPAAVLEKLIAYEAVHAIQGWDDLHRRLAPDRRCFGFFHPALPGEPLIFVEVALVTGLATSVQPLLGASFDEQSAREQENNADTAIFYSISNCQDGLRGISFGNFLIKQVVEELQSELPRLEQFATLSPVPGFRRWLEARLAAGDAGWLRAEERAGIFQSAGMPEDAAEDGAALAALLRADKGWEDPIIAEALKAPLTRLCAIYLSEGGNKPGADPVARFHLGNGARLERVNWLGNTAARGIRESCGIMVNYLYDPDMIEANHEAFVHEGAVARSAAVDALMATPPAGRSVRASRNRRG